MALRSRSRCRSSGHSAKNTRLVLMHAAHTRES
jgi:hypothetical protein